MRKAWRQAGLLSLLLGAGLLQLALPYFDAPAHSLVLGLIFFHLGLWGLFGSPPSQLEKASSSAHEARVDDSARSAAPPTLSMERDR